MNKRTFRKKDRKLLLDYIAKKGINGLESHLRNIPYTDYTKRGKKKALRTGLKEIKKYLDNPEIEDAEKQKYRILKQKYEIAIKQLQ